jgi:small subunit ribosomal protein S20
MPNIKSAKKRVLVTKVNNERNRAYRSALRTAIKKADAAVDAKAADAAETVKVAVKEIDSAVSKGIIHKNNAARKKSNLQKRLNNMA